MKKYLFSAITLKLVMFLAACQSKGLNTKSSLSSVEQDGKSVKTITSKNDSVSLNIKYAGEIQFNADETAIKSISPQGYLRYQKNDQKLTAESNSDGVIVYKLEDGRKELALDDNGKKFIAASLKEMIAYGFGLEKRLATLYANGGSRAVLGEVENMRNDDLRAACFGYLLSSAVLQPEELAEVARKIEVDLNTDVEKRKLLSRYAADFLKNPQTVQPYFAAIGSIATDYEKASVLGSLVKTGIKTEEQWVNLLNMTAQVSSTAEKTNLMLQIAGKMPKNGEAETAYMKTAKTITANAEYGQVMKAIQ